MALAIGTPRRSLRLQEQRITLGSGIARGQRVVVVLDEPNQCGHSGHRRKGARAAAARRRSPAQQAVPPGHGTPPRVAARPGTASGPESVRRLSIIIWRTGICTAAQYVATPTSAANRTDAPWSCRAPPPTRPRTQPDAQRDQRDVSQRGDCAVSSLSVQPPKLASPASPDEAITPDSCWHTPARRARQVAGRRGAPPRTRPKFGNGVARAGGSSPEKVRSSAAPNMRRRHQRRDPPRRRRRAGRQQR